MTTVDRIAYTSKLKDMSPAIKAGLAVSTLLGVLVVSQNIFSVVVFALMTALCTAGSGLPLRQYRKMCAIPFWFLLAGAAVVAVGFSEVPAGLWHVRIFGVYLVVTLDSLCWALELFLRSMAGVSCLYFLCVTTPVNDLLGLLNRMHAPKLLTELMMMIYRFIFLLAGLAGQMAVAQKARLGNAGYRASLRSVSMLASSVFVCAFQKSAAIYDAMESRGYDGNFDFTGELSRSTGRQRLIFAAYEVLLIGAVVAVKWIAG